MLVGQSGSGKTNALCSCLLSRMQAGHDIRLIDTKNDMSQIFENHVSCYDRNEVSDLIRTLTEKARSRMDLFSRKARELKRPIRDLAEYNKVTGEDLPVISIVVEELVIITDLIDEDELTELFVAGRSSGVFFVCLTQRLNIDILSTTASNNFLTRVYLGAPDKVAFRSVFPGGVPKNIQEESSRHLGPPGNALMYSALNNSYKCITFPRVSEDMLIELMQ